MPDGEHQMINIALAGVRCARTPSKQGEPSELWAEEVSKLTCRSNRLRIAFAGEIFHGVQAAPATCTGGYTIVANFDSDTIPSRCQQCSTSTSINIYWHWYVAFYVRECVWQFLLQSFIPLAMLLNTSSPLDSLVLSIGMLVC